ncbi:hypothetical protein LOD99_13106 [Oopsacas minuta]|uniref:BBSome complex member BBS5 PH domain-containing protein n=1 Tax=Oopsacas minuta TaxID=111878 RepID=A0AAV7JAW7_9METZ|nr:hypothetical protein LOD99_13106 [Oopsacas minuta]
MSIKEVIPESLWEDRSVKFDVPMTALKLRPGEVMIEQITDVEDTKGNNGDKGKLVITNLRLVWIHELTSKVNLSIGYLNFINTSMINTESRLRGNTESLKILTRYSKTKYEFIFTNLVRDTPWLHGLIKNIIRAYETSKLYRDIKLKGSIIDNGQLRMLPKEEVYNKVDGVWNLSSEQGTLGTFFITNVRVIWHAAMNDMFNLSLPFIQIKHVCMRDSKFGKALVLESSPLSGGYLLGFRMDPPSKLKEVLKEMQSLHTIFSLNPILGVECILYQMFRRKSSCSKDKSLIKVIRTSSLLIPDLYWDFRSLICPVAISLHPTTGIIAILCIFEEVRFYTVDGYFITKLTLRAVRRRGVSFRVTFAAITLTDHLFISQNAGSNIYHLTDYKSSQLSLPIQFYDCDKNDNIYATCYKTGNIQIFSSTLEYKRDFPGYTHSNDRSVGDLRLMKDYLAVEVIEHDFADINSVLLYSLCSEQLIRRFKPDESFIQVEFQFCLDQSLNILIHNSFGNKLVICDFIGRNSNLIISEDMFFKGRKTILRGSFSRHVLRGIRMNEHNQLIRCFSSGAVRVTQFNPLKKSSINIV